MFSNLWNHPKTTAVGLLLAIVTIGGVFLQQGVTLGNLGTGNVVSLAIGVATALLGLLARDPSSSSTTSTAKLGAWMLISLTLLGTMPMVGCTQKQKITVAQEIVNWAPVFISTADTVNAAVEALDPATILVLRPLTLAIDTFGPQFQLAAQNYLANPNQTTLQVLQALIVQIQQNTNTALLKAAKITNPASQATATRNINLVATIANTLLALVQGISTKAQVAQMATGVHVTLAQVRPYLDQDSMQAASVKVSRDIALSVTPTPDQFFAYESRAGF